MSDKKKAKKKPSLNLDGRIDELDAINSAAHRVNNVIQKMTEPPETVLSHLKRIGIEPIIDQMSLDDGDPKTYILFGYEELLDKELQNIKAGSEFSSTYPPDFKSPRMAEMPAQPILLEEIRKRMKEAMKIHPSQMKIDDVLSEDDWPITGENPL